MCQRVTARSTPIEDGSFFLRRKGCRHSHGYIPCGAYILAGGGAVDQGVERVDKFFILVWLDHVGIGA